MSDTALLVQDLQNGIVDMVAEASIKDDYLKKVNKTIEAARKAGIKIIYVVVSFRKGHPEVSPTNAMFGRVKEMGGFLRDTESTTVNSLVAPAEGDVIVEKHRVGAFSGTDMEIVLRAQGIKKLVLTGIATSGVVLSTVRHAADHDYNITVLDDLCLDRDPEVHKVLTEKVFPGQAKVQKSEEWIASL